MSNASSILSFESVTKTEHHEQVLSGLSDLVSITTFTDYLLEVITQSDTLEPDFIRSPLDTYLKPSVKSVLSHNIDSTNNNTIVECIKELKRRLSAYDPASEGILPLFEHKDFVGSVYEAYITYKTYTILPKVVLLTDMEGLGFPF